MRKFNRPLAALAGIGLSVLVSLGAPIGSAVTAVAAPTGAIVALNDGGSAPTVPDDAVTPPAQGGEQAPTTPTTPTTPANPSTPDAMPPGGGEGDQANSPEPADFDKKEDSAEEVVEDTGATLFSVVVPDGNYYMPSPDRPYLKFEINDPETGQPIEIPGSAVTIQGARSGTNSTTWARWNNSVTVLDCVTGDEPCGASSLDQDSRPGRFAVDRLSPGETEATKLSSTRRYRIGAGPTGAAPVGYQWTMNAPANLRDDSAGITASIAPVGTNNTTNVNTARTNPAPAEWTSVSNPGGTGSNMVHDFARTQNDAGPPVLAQSPSITWKVTQDGTPVGGATVAIQGPRTGSTAWGDTYYVADCTSAPDPCGADSVDQDPQPGQFKIYNLRTTAGAVVSLATGTTNSRYRLVPAGSAAPVSTQFTSTSEVVQTSPGNTNNTQGTWNGTPPAYDFGDVAVQTAPSLFWEVKNGVNGPLVGGATVRVRHSTNSTASPNTGNYDIVDCASFSEPCAADSLDQDPVAGQFRVYNLSSSLAVSTDRRYQLQPRSPAPSYTEWVTTAGSWSTSHVSPTNGFTGTPPQYVFSPLVLRNSPSIVWEVREGNQTSGALIGGATVKISGPRTSSSSWGTEREVIDCVQDPCKNLMDQDPEPGKFRVHSIGIGENQTQVVSGNRYRIMAFSSPFGMQWTAPTVANAWVESSGNNNVGTGWSNNQYAFQNLVLAPANSLKWSVKEQGTNIVVGGATVRLQSGTTGPVYYVSDCTVDPCHPDSMDQDPEPGVFQVDTLRGLNGSTQTALDVTRTQYSIATAGSLPGYVWVTPSNTWQSSPTWVTGSLQNEFATPLQVGPRSPDFDPTAFCAAPPTDGQYYTLSRGTSSSASSEIRALRPTFNAQGSETGIANWSETVPNSSGTVVGTGQTTNALGITPTGVFYYTGQVGGTAETGRNVTVYRFDPKFDTAPYPVFNMDLLSPTTGTVVSGDATIYEGREEFYFAYYSDSPVLIGGVTAIRFHLYRYSAGDGDRTGEVRHIDVPRPNGMGNYNGDFAFTATNDLQFIISDNDGRYSSGVVAGDDFIHEPSAHALPDVTDVEGTAVTSSTANTSLGGINGIAYTKSGRAIMQRNAQASTGNQNFLGTAPNLSVVGSTQTFTGYLVDLASCDSPSTITVKKEVVGPRYNVNDQFTLTAQRQVGTQTPEQFAPATTTGPATGVQDNQIGPFVMTLDGTLTASETFTQNEDRYETGYECKIVGAETSFLPFTGYAPDATNRTLSFSLDDRGKIKPGDQVECVFKNRRYTADLKVSKTADPVSGTTVEESTADDASMIRYVVTFDNTNGSAPARNIAYTDWLKDVFDDADPVLFPGGHRFEYRSSTSGAWSATPATPPNQVVGQDINIGAIGEPTVAFTGLVPAHELRQVSFLVQVKRNAAERDDRLSEEAPLKGYLLRNYLTQDDVDTKLPTPPPATCEIPTGPGALPMCTEHPIQAWTVSKSVLPADGAKLHKGGNAHYRIVAEKLNAGTEISGLVFTDDLTNVFKTAGFAPNAAVPGGALIRGIYFFDKSGNTLGPVTTIGQDGAVNATVTAAYSGEEGVPNPVEVGGRWTITSPSVIVPSNAVRAEMWFAVQAGESPVDIPSTFSGGGPNTGDKFTNYVTAVATDQPLNCSTSTTTAPNAEGNPDTSFPEECRVTNELQDSFFTIRKDASGPAVDAVNVKKDESGQTVVTNELYGLDVTGMTDMIGQEFSIRDRVSGDDSAPDYSSKYLCRTSYNPGTYSELAVSEWDAQFTATTDSDADWGEDSPTLAAIKAWNSQAPADEQLPLCALAYPQGPGAGAQQGRWRVENLPGVGDVVDSTGLYWLVETKAPAAQRSLTGTQTRPVPGIQLLAQPIPFTVWGLADTTDTWNGGSSQEGLSQLDVLAGTASGGATGTGRPTTTYTDRCPQNSKVGERNTACVNPTGYLLVVKDTGPTPLPLTGGTNWAQILGVAGGVILAGAVGGTLWWRRRQLVHPAAAVGTESGGGRAGSATRGGRHSA